MIMKKNYLLLLLTIISIPAFADRGELYAWHELNNTGGESILSFIFHSILLLLIGIPALFFGLCGIFKGERIKESFKLGCFGFCVILFFILGIIIRNLFT